MRWGGREQHGKDRSMIRTLAKSASAVLAWNVARLASQLMWVLLLARALGPHGYGTFSGLAGLGLALGGFAALGMGLRLYEHVARDHAVLDRHWALVRFGMAWSAPLMLVLYLACVFAMRIDAAMLVIVAIGVAEIVLAPLCTQVAFAYASVGRMGESAAAPVVLSLARVIAAAGYLLIAPAAGLGGYVVLHVLATLAAVVWIWRRAHLQLELSRRSQRAELSELRSGLGFASIWASGLALTSLDKTAVMQAGGGAVAGEYTAGYRLASIAALPVEALTTTIMPRLFRAGAGRPLPVRTTLLLVVAVLAYGLVAGRLVGLAVPLVPVLLGEGFGGLAPLVALFGWWLPAYCLRTLLGNMLLGHGRKRARISAELSGLAVLVTLVLWWVPGAGLAGAMKALLVAEWWIACVSLMMMMWTPPGRATRSGTL
jgi:O-antigen/teichoic acid export membrane protein